MDPKAEGVVDNQEADIVISGEAEEQDLENEDEDNEEPEAGKREPGSEEEASDDDESEEVTITIGDDSPSSEDEDERAQAPEWVRELRKSHRETQRENRELKERLAKLETPRSEEIKVGPKPTLEAHDYDTEAYEAALETWYETKRKAKAKEAEARAEQDKQAKAWNDRVSEYGEMKSKLKVKDFDEAEEAVIGIMNQTQQGIIVQGAENPAMVIYALGKNDAEAKKLAAITDPVKFAVAIGKLEDKLKVKPRKAPKAAPEKTVRGSAPISGSVDSTLERLREEAAKTGDYTKIAEYKRQKRQANG